MATTVGRELDERSVGGVPSPREQRVWPATFGGVGAPRSQLNGFILIS